MSRVAAVSRVTLASIAGQAPALAVPVVMAWRYGASGCTDAMFLALAIASFVVTTVQSAGQNAVVPFLVETLHGVAPLGPVLRAVRRVVLATTVGVLAAGATVAFAFVPVTTGCGASWRGYLVAFVPYIMCAGLAGLAVAVLNAERRYIAAALSPVVRWSAVVLAVALLAQRFGLWAAPLGYGLGEAVRWIVLQRLQTPAAGASGPQHGHLGFAKSAAAQVAASAILALTPVLDRVMVARALDAGSVSLLEYVDRIWQIPIGLAVSGLLVMALAEWSHQTYGGAAVRRLVVTARRTALLAAAVAVVPTALIVVARHPISGVLFRRGAMGDAALPVLADTLRAVFLATPVYLAGLTYGRALLVLKRSDWLLVAAVLQLGVKIVGNVVLLPHFGLPGVALATSAMYAVGSCVLIGALHAAAKSAAPAAGGSN